MAIDQSTEYPGLMGWGYDNHTSQDRVRLEQQSIQQMMTAMPACQFERAAKRVVGSPILEKVYELQKADGIEEGFSFRYLEQAIWKAPLKWLAQTIGSCVASGAMRALFGRTMAEIFLFGQPEEFFGTDSPDQNSPNSICCFAPYHYGMGRQVGGMDSNGDGSFCGAQIQALMAGFLPCWSNGLNRYTDQFPEPLNSESIYRKWGDASYRSVRQQFASVAADFKVTESTQVQSFEKSKEFITQHFKPQMICSSWGFGPKSQITGTPFWIYGRSGSWAHNMTRYGCLKIKGNWYTEIKNSWGMSAHKNGDYFLVPAEEDERWLRDAEARTIGELTLPESMPQV